MWKSLAHVRHSALFLTLLVASLAAQAPRSKGTSPHPRPQSSEPALPPVELPAEPGLYAILYTSSGQIVCRLFEKDSPKTVANFVGLATGRKPWTDPASGRLKHTSLYSGTTFHRVIPGFMIQGGDPLGTGMGDPGYKFEDEFNGNHVFDKPGILAMANSGPNTNGSQFFITVAPTEHLNGKHTIFGEVVSGQDVADAISKAPTDSDDKPVTPIKIVRILIRRVPQAGGAGSPQKTAGPN